MQNGKLCQVSWDRVFYAYPFHICAFPQFSLYALPPHPAGSFLPGHIPVDKARVWVRLSASPLPSSGIKVVYPPDCFGVGDLSEVSLGGRQVRVPEDHLAHDLHWDS